MKTINVISVIFIGIFLVAEISARIFQDKFLDHIAGNPPVFQYDSIIGYTYIPNLMINEDHKKFSVNSEGFIGPELPLKKESGTYRIAFLGACSVAGAVHLDFYTNPCMVLQDLFKKNSWNVEILNFGIDGSYKLYQTYKLIEYKVTKYNPDLILCQYILPFVSRFYIRDSYRGYVLEYPNANSKIKDEQKEIIDLIYRYKALFKLYDYLYSVKAICKYYMDRHDLTLNTNKLARAIGMYKQRKIQTTSISQDMVFTKETSKIIMKDLIKRLETHGIEFAFFQYGRDEVLKNTCKSDSISLVSLNINFDSTMIVPKDNHFNLKGYQTIGNKFYNYLSCKLPVKYKTN